MGFDLADMFSIPINKTVCTKCIKKNTSDINYLGVHSSGSFNMYNIPIKVGQQIFTVTLDITEIILKKEKKGHYLETIVAQCICPRCDEVYDINEIRAAQVCLMKTALCNEGHAMELVECSIKSDNGKLIAKGIFYCDTCHKLTTEDIENNGGSFIMGSLEDKIEIFNNIGTTKVASNHNDRRFKIALSFPGEFRETIVEKIAFNLLNKFSKDEILYDMFHKAEFAMPNLDTYLQGLYHDESDLIVIFLCKNYGEKTWCKLEWRAIRDLINKISKNEMKRIMLIKIGEEDFTIDGIFFSTDGYLTISEDNIEETTEAIIKRYSML